MQPIKLKVCGMMNHENILEMAGMAPDFMGFIFYEKSPRYVGEDFKMVTLDFKIQKVGVFVNEDIEVMIEKVEECKLNYVQLHGDESPEACECLKKHEIKVIKVFFIDSQFDFSSLKSYEPMVDFFLFDTKGKLKGGNGVCFDWNILKNYEGLTPFFLSGGINASNIVQLQAIKNDRLYAIDVNSGVEDTPGIKSKKKLGQVIQNFRIAAL